MKTKRLTLLGLLSAIALTIFMVEAQIPALVPIPGIKMGLANIITVAPETVPRCCLCVSSWALCLQAISVRFSTLPPVDFAPLA